jgi:hypothetical protein
MARDKTGDKAALKKNYGLRLDQALMKDLAHLGVDKDKWVNELVEEAVRDLLVKYKKAAPK